jgi:uncharacterized membrane protein
VETKTRISDGTRGACAWRERPAATFSHATPWRRRAWQAGGAFYAAPVVALGGWSDGGTPNAWRPRMATLYSKAKLLGHPIHPMLVAFPITFFSSTLLGSIAYLATSDRDWFRLAYFANVAGVVTALIAAVPGFLDWTGIPSHLRAKQVGIVHLTLNLIVVAIFTLNLGMQGAQLSEAVPSGWSGFVLSLLGVMLLLMSGYYGWTLVQTHHVGIDLTREQELLDRTRQGLGTNVRPPHDRDMQHHAP